MAEQGPVRRLQMTLLSWYDANARVLPWRATTSAEIDPYKVWLSEIMLQQTTVAAVKDYFLKFTRAWPTVGTLANAPLDDVLRAWAGLGYYARARNLHACAKAVVTNHGGQFPDTPEQLQKLPGIGPYTSGAIAAIAFGKPIAAVDGNVERVMSRVYAIETPLPASKPDIKMRAQAMMPSERAGDFVQALMDLGATICTPKSPQCGACPWAGDCLARQRGIASILPRKAPKKSIPTRTGIAYVTIRQDGAVLLRRRPEKGLLGGMMEIPGALSSDAGPPLSADWKKLPGRVEHTFTHFHLEVTVMRAKIQAAPAPGSADCWIAASDLHGEALPTLMRKILTHAGL